MCRRAVRQLSRARAIGFAGVQLDLVELLLDDHKRERKRC